MHCPQCGLEQVSGETRFCRTCGFALEDVKELFVPDKRTAKEVERLRSSAFNQGLGLMLVSLVAVILMTLLRDLDLVPQFYVKLVGALFVLAGLGRMFYPYVADAAKNWNTEPQVARPETSKLPGSLPPQSTEFADFDQPPTDTARFADAPSVTEHTTRKLREFGEDI